LSPMGGVSWEAAAVRDRRLAVVKSLSTGSAGFRQLSTDCRRATHLGLDKHRLEKGRSPLGWAGVCPAVCEIAGLLGLWRDFEGCFVAGYRLGGPVEAGSRGVVVEGAESADQFYRVDSA
jgi:hypothetical protein